jgi:hypothetical protein
MSARNTLTKMALGELVRSRSYRIAFAVIALFLVGILHFIGVRLLLNPLVERETLDRGLLLAAASGLVYCTVLICAGLFLNISSTQPLVRAKASGSIESLLAAPVDARDLWRALSIASILPGIVAGWAGGLVSAIIYELLYLAPRGMTLASPWIILNSFILLPAMYAAIAFLVHAVGLQGRATSGAVIAQIFLPVYTSLAMNLGGRDILAVPRADLAAAQFGLALIVLGATALSLRGLTKERIVLSCRQ